MTCLNTLYSNSTSNRLICMPLTFDKEKVYFTSHCLHFPPMIDRLTDDVTMTLQWDQLDDGNISFDFNHSSMLQITEIATYKIFGSLKVHVPMCNLQSLITFCCDIFLLAEI